MDSVINRRKAILLLLSIAILSSSGLCLIGCSEREKESINAITEPFVNSPSEFVVRVDNVSLAESNYDEGVVLFQIFYQNNSDKEQSFDDVIWANAYQNGIELQPLSRLSDTNSDGDQDVKPGSSMTVHKYYRLRDNSPVSIECIEHYLFKDDIVVAEGTYNL